MIEKPVALTINRVVIVLGLLLGAVLITAVVHALPAAESAAPVAGNQDMQLYLPLTAYDRTDRWSRDTLFGLQTYGSSRPDSKYYKELMESNTTWLRIPIRWEVTEPIYSEPAMYNWTHVDASLAAAERSGVPGLRIIATFEAAPQWARLDPLKPDGPIYSAYLGRFAEFVGALVERYDGDGIDDAPGSPIVEYWEFYNEPDRLLHHTGGRWGDYGAEYAAMLAATYPALKSANPNAKSVFGGIAYDFFEDQNGPFRRTFLDDVLAAGGGAYFDIFNYHGYPAFARNWLPVGQEERGPGLYEKGIFLRNKLNAAGVYKPFIVTEAGWQSSSSPFGLSSEEIQARYVAQLFAQSFAADIDIMIWWMLENPGSGIGDYGLITTDTPPVRKLAFTAFRNIVNLMTDKEFVRALPAADTSDMMVEAYEFRDKYTGIGYYMAWLNPVDTTDGANIIVAAEEVRTIDLYGTVGPTILDAADGADDGRVRVPITAQPVYIEVLR